MEDEDGRGLWHAIMRSSRRIKKRGWVASEQARLDAVSSSSKKDSDDEPSGDESMEELLADSQAREKGGERVSSVRSRDSGVADSGSADSGGADSGSGERERERGLHGRLAQRLRRGTIPIEDRIDLHGMTRVAAAGVLRARIPQSYANGVRFLLVITGKGKGLLRDDLPMLLDGVELRGLVLGHCLARNKDGGEGARYVLLRKKKTRLRK